MTTTYIATIRHNSISRARRIEITGTLTQAKRAATKEFGDEQTDYSIVVAVKPDSGYPYIVASKGVADRRWTDLDSPVAL